MVMLAPSLTPVAVAYSHTQEKETRVPSANNIHLSGFEALNIGIDFGRLLPEIRLNHLHLLRPL